MPPDATTPSTDTSETTPRRRRVPGWIWVFTPLAIGLLYAAGHALFAPEPTLANLPPPEAVLVQRFRDLDTLDRVSFGPRGPKVRATREVVAQERNVPGLPGVDHTAPVHLVLLPRGRHQDASMAIFQVEDADAFEQAFMRTDFLERGLIRHAQHLHIGGDFAAVGPSRDIARRIGRGDLTCEDKGEDYCIAADIPGLVEHVMKVPKQYPWREILEALGVRPGETTFVRDAETGATRAVIPGATRVERIRTSWDRVKLWGWMDDGRIQVDLHPSAGGRVAQALATRAERLEVQEFPIEINTLLRDAPPHAPSDAEAWLRIPYDVDRALLADVLLACGVRFVSEDEGVDLLGGLGAGVERRTTADMQEQRGVLLWATRGAGTGYAWTLGMAASSGHLPALKNFLPLPGAEGGSVPLPEGAAPVTSGDTTVPRTAPAGTVELAPAVPWTNGAAEDERTPRVDLVTFGPSAEAAMAGMKNHLAVASKAPADPRQAWDPGEGFEHVASAWIKVTRARQLLDRALEPGGFLAALAGGHIRAALYTDGTMLRLLLWREAV